MHQVRSTRLLALALAAGSAACSAAGIRGASYVIVDTATNERVEFDTFVDRVTSADVLFLGEQHDNTTCHELQHWTTLALAKRRPVTLSLEQFEADVQGTLDAYLQGEISEAAFLAKSRPWPNYEADYRPTLEWARGAGVPVIAANIPRPLARRVSRGGWEELGVIGNEHSPWALNVDEPQYRARFEVAMGNHSGTENHELDDWFAAQCVKDDRMAESIVHHLRGSDADAPLVIHWCGRFHSDYRLGAVSRLAKRRPDLKIMTVSMETTDDLNAPLPREVASSADFVWWIR